MSLFDSVPQRPNAYGTPKKPKKQKSLGELLYDHPTSRPGYVPPVVHPTSLDTFTAAKPEPAPAPKPKPQQSTPSQPQSSLASLLYDHPTSQQDYVTPVVHPTSRDTNTPKAPTPRPALTPAQPLGLSTTAVEKLPAGAALSRPDFLEKLYDHPSWRGYVVESEGRPSHQTLELRHDASPPQLQTLEHRGTASDVRMMQVDSSEEGRAYTTNPEWEDGEQPYWVPYDHPKDQAQAIESQRGLGQDATAGSNGLVGPGYPQKEEAPKPAYTLPENATAEDIARAKAAVGARLDRWVEIGNARMANGGALNLTPEEKQALEADEAAMRQLDAMQYRPSPGALAASDARARDSIARIEAMDQGLPDPAPNGAARMAMPGENGRTTMDAPPATRRELVKDLAKSWSEADIGEMYGWEPQAKKDILALQDSNPSLFEEVNAHRAMIGTYGESTEPTPDMKLDYRQQRLEHGIQETLNSGLSPDQFIEAQKSMAAGLPSGTARFTGQQGLARNADYLRQVVAKRAELKAGGFGRGAAAQGASGQMSGNYGSAPKGGSGAASSARQKQKDLNSGGAGFRPTDPVVEALERQQEEARRKAKLYNGYNPYSQKPAPRGGKI